MELCDVEDLEGLDFGFEEEEDPGASSSTAHWGAARFSLPHTGTAAIGSESSMPLVTARPAEGKHCNACMVSALVPSPLCPGPFRQGDYPDWSSNWDKPCASMSRIR